MVSVASLLMLGKSYPIDIYLTKNGASALSQALRLMLDYLLLCWFPQPAYPLRLVLPFQQRKISFAGGLRCHGSAGGYLRTCRWTGHLQICPRKPSSWPVTYTWLSVHHSLSQKRRNAKSPFQQSMTPHIQKPHFVFCGTSLNTVTYKIQCHIFNF